MLKLEKKNAHPRDKRITFDDPSHTYKVDGELTRSSVTGFVGQYFDKFDAEEVARKMVARPGFWTQAKYSKYHCFKDAPDPEKAIKDEWERFGTEQSDLGTAMHRQIELFYNDEVEELPDTPELRYFKHYHALVTHFQGFRPVRTEWCIFDEASKLCGSVDMLYIDDKGKFHMRDWKRSKKISSFGFGRFGKPPLGHLPECNLSKYRLQLNTYAYILRENYGLDVASMAIVVFHPDAKGFQEIRVPDMRGLVKQMFEQITL